MMQKRKVKQTIIVTLPGGGHTSEMLELTKHLGNFFKYEYVFSRGENISKKKVIYPGKYFYMTRPRILARNWLLPLTFLVSFLESFLICIRSEAKVLVTAGPGLAIPLAFWFKFFGRKVIFIDDLSRVYEPSITGRIIQKLGLADRLFVQWEKLLQFYPSAKYSGKLL